MTRVKIIGEEEYNYEKFEKLKNYFSDPFFSSLEEVSKRPENEPYARRITAGRFTSFFLRLYEIVWANVLFLRSYPLPRYMNPLRRVIARVLSVSGGLIGRLNNFLLYDQGLQKSLSRLNDKTEYFEYCPHLKPFFYLFFPFMYIIRHFHWKITYAEWDRKSLVREAYRQREILKRSKDDYVPFC